MLATTRNLPQAFEAAKSSNGEEEDRFRGIDITKNSWHCWIW